MTAIRFEEGQYVKADQILVELEDAEARAAVAAARAELLDSESKYKRDQELFRSDLIPESQVETSEARRDADKAALDAAEARLAETVVRAPFSGRVGLRRVSLGGLVGPSTVITTLDDTDTIKLDFDVPETSLGLLEEGLPVVARSAAWPEEVFEGKVASIDTRIDPVSRTLTLRARLPNQKHLLRPGMFLTVELLRRDVTALVVHEQSIVPEQSRQYVLVVGDDNVVSKREVTIGRRRPGQVEILKRAPGRGSGGGGGHPEGAAGLPGGSRWEARGRAVIISDVSVRRPVFATVISLLLVILGLAALLNLPVRQYPAVDPPVVSIETPIAEPRPRWWRRRSPR